MALKISDAHKRLVRDSSKTLAIVGKFNPEKDSSFVFSNKQSKEGSRPISAEAFFGAVEPALSLKFNETTKIGPNVYNKYSITTPLEAAGESEFQLITSDSPLLNRDSEVFNAAKVKLMQKHGGKLVSEMVANLDKLANFTHSNFSRSLLKIARDYLYHHVLDSLGSFSQRVWFNVLESNYALSAEILKYLTSYGQDEEPILAAVRAHMINDTSDEKLTQAEQGAIEEALKRCKHVMKGSLKDSVWEACAKFESNSDWLNNYAGHEKYGLPALSFVGGRDFLKYYQAFLNASEATHRMVRSQTLHPYIFMWLSSKYANWDEGEFNKASDVMYNIGVEGQGDKRIPGETFAERSDMFERIKAAKLNKEFDKQLKDDEMFQETFLAIAEDHTFSALLAEKSVTMASLRYRAKKLFSRLSQLAGGTVGELLTELDAFNALFVPFYRIIKNTRADEKGGYRLKDFEERLMDTVGEKVKEKFPEVQSFLEGVIANAQRAFEQNKDASKDLKTIVTQEFVSAYGGVSKNHFAKHYLDNHEKIQGELEETENLYDIIRNQQQVSTQSELVGSPVVVTVETALPDARKKNIEKFRQGIYEQQLESGRSQGNTPIVKVGARPENLKNVEGIFSVVDAKGQELAKAKLTDTNQIEYEVSPDKVEQLIKDDKAVLKIDEGSAPTEVLMTTTDFPFDDLREVVETQKRDEKEVKQLLSQNAKLAEKQDKIIAEYRKDSADKALTKGQRALTLCEYILAVPKSQSQLGKPDISNVLGLMVDIVENLVEPNNPKVIDELLVQKGKPSPELSRINLSKYYPVADSDELWDIVNYQYQLAREISGVQSYLQELAEIRAFMQAMAETNVKVIFVNNTLEELADEHPSQLVFNRDDGGPAVVYLTSQAKVSSSSVQALASTLARYAGKNIMANFQMPVFVSSEKLDFANSAALPLYSASQLGLDFDLIETSGDGKKQTVPKEGILTDKFIQKNPYLLLAASVMLPEGSQSFGQIKQIARKTFDTIHDGFRIETRPGQPLVDMLRSVWLKSNKPLLDALVFCRWFNQILLTLPQDESITLADNQFSVKLEENVKAGVFDKLDGFDTPLQVYVKDERGNFNRPENLKGGTAILNLKATFGTNHRGQKVDTLNVPFKDNFYSVVAAQGNGGSEQAVSEVEAKK